MSHRDECPSPYQSRRDADWDARQGYRNYGYGGNCHESRREYEREFEYQTNRIQEERAEQRAAQHRREAREQAEYEEMLSYQQAEEERAYEQWCEEQQAMAFDDYCAEGLSWQYNELYEVPRWADDGGFTP